MGFYGNITNTTRTQFSFDQIYANRKEMDTSIEGKKTDGVYLGRYVLVEYDKEINMGLDCYKQIEQRTYIDDDNESQLAWFFKDEPLTNASAVIKNRDVDTTTIYYVVVSDAEAQGSIYPYRFYNVPSVGTIQTDPAVFVELTNWNNSNHNSTSVYVNNYQIDYYTYINNGETNADGIIWNNGQLEGVTSSRGWDSTVWQKVHDSSTGKDKYVMIAELNTVVPTFSMNIDPPTTIPLNPHFDKDSTNVSYKIHWQPQWGFRVAQATDNYTDDNSLWLRYDYNAVSGKGEYQYYDPNYSGGDDTTGSAHWRKLNNFNNLEEKAIIPSAIYYNKAGFSDDLSYHNDKENKITILPTGVSGYKYSTHDYNLTQQNDIQEMTIQLPVIGNAIATVWDVLYGTHTEEAEPGKYKRYRDFQWKYIGEPNYENGDASIGGMTRDLSTISGTINKAHDLMGMIISRQAPETAEQISAADQNYIYKYANDNSYKYKHLTYEYHKVNYDFVEKVGLTEGEWVPDIFYFLNDTPEINEIYEQTYGPALEITATTYDTNGLYYRDTTNDIFYAVNSEDEYDEHKEYHYIAHKYVRDKADAFDPSKTYYEKHVGSDAYTEARNLLNWDSDTDTYYYKDLNNNYFEGVTAVPQEDKSYYKFLSGYPLAITIEKNYRQNGFYYYDELNSKYSVETAVNPRDINYYTLNPKLAIQAPYYKPNTYYIFPDKVKFDVNEDNYVPNTYYIIVDDTYVLDDSVDFDDTKNYYVNGITNKGIIDAEDWQKGYFTLDDNGVYHLADEYDAEANYYEILVGPNDNRNLTFDENADYYQMTFENRVVIKDNEATSVWYATACEKVNLGNYEPNLYYYPDGTIEGIVENYILSDSTTPDDTIPAMYIIDENENVSVDTGEVDEYEQPIYESIPTLYLEGPLYIAGKYYYQSENRDFDNVLVSTDYVVDSNISKVPGRSYFSIPSSVLINDISVPVVNGPCVFYEGNKYYYEDPVGSGNFILDTDSVLNQGVTYYTRSNYYVIEDISNILNVGALWNNKIMPVPNTVNLGVRFENYEMKTMEGYSIDSSTINGLILQTTKMLDANHNYTRDLSTVQGCINTAQDMIAKFPADLNAKDVLTVDAYGRIHGATQTTSQEYYNTNYGILEDGDFKESVHNTSEDQWIYWDIDDNTKQPTITAKHQMHTATNTTTTADINGATDVNPGLNTGKSDSIKLYTPIVDNKGHIVGKNEETVELPYGFKKITASNSTVTSAWAQEENKPASADENVLAIVADETQDTLALKAGNKWLRIQTSGTGEDNNRDAQPNNEQIITLAHETHDIDTTLRTSNLNTDNIISANDSDKITFQDLVFDTAGHVTENHEHTYTLPYGFKTIKTNGRSVEVSENVDLTNRPLGLEDIVAENTQDSLNIDSGNKWIRIDLNSTNDSLTIRHDVHDFTSGTFNTLYGLANNEDYTLDESQIGNLDNDNTFEVPAFKFDEAGHITMAETHTVKLPENFDKITTKPSDDISNNSLSGSNSTTLSADNMKDTLTIAEGNRWINIENDTVNDTLTFKHYAQLFAEGTAITDLDNQQTFTVQEVVWDRAGHLTASTKRTYTLPDNFKTIAILNNGVDNATDQADVTNANLIASNQIDIVAFDTGNRWIALKGESDNKKVSLYHRAPNTSSTSTTRSSVTEAQTPTFNTTFNLPIVKIDETGHIFGGETTTVTIPGINTSGDANATGADVVTQLSFTNSTGTIGTTRANISSLKLTGYKEGNEVTAISVDDTLGSAIGKLEKRLDVLVGGSDEALDTLKEISDWIESNGTGSAKLITRVNALETATSTTLPAAIEEAESNAKAYADGLAGNYDANGSAAAVQGSTSSTVKSVEDRVKTLEDLSIPDASSLADGMYVLKKNGTTIEWVSLDAWIGGTY